MSAFCTGCFSNFTDVGYANHITQTRNPACRAVHDRVRVSAGPPPDLFDTDTSTDIPEDQITVQAGFHNCEDGEIEDLDVDVGESDEEEGEEVDVLLERLEIVQDLHSGEDNDVEMMDGTDVSNGAVQLQSHEDNVERPPDIQAHLSHALGCKVHVENFPLATAGQPVRMPAESNPTATGYDKFTTEDPQQNIYAPFNSQLDWEVARWAKLRGPGSTAMSDLLAIPGVQEKLNVSYKNSRELNSLVDRLPTSRPRFKREEVTVGGEQYDVYFRDVLKCIDSLYSDPEFARHLVFRPERHYADEDKTERLYHDMHTGKWWWATQKLLEKDKPGATIIPVIVSTDKTQVTLFRNKSAYPIYLTIGNLPKDIRSKPSQRGQILLGYLPTTKLEHVTNVAARRRMLANLFHACMRRILSPLEQVGLEGVEMMSGDGVVRRVHPLLAAYVSDYPEQVLVTGIKTGECPICTVPHDELGDYDHDEQADFRDIDQVLKIMVRL